MLGAMHRGLTCAILLLVIPAAAQEAASPLAIDADAGHMGLFVRKRGAFKAFAHDHDLAARVYSGSVTWDASAPERSRVELEIDVNGLAIIDSKLDASDRKKVRHTTL